MFRRLSKQLVDSVKSTYQDIRSQTMPQIAAYKANGLHEQEQGETPPLLAVLRAVLRHKSSLHALSLRLMGLRVIPKYILKHTIIYYNFLQYTIVYYNIL